MPRVTQALIARETGISQSSVSLVLSNPETSRVSRDKKEQIFDFLRREDPASLPENSVSHICYLTHKNSDITSDLYARLLSGAESEAREAGVNLIFKRWSSAEDFNDIINDKKISGIIHSGKIAEKYIPILQETKPLVILNDIIDPMICSMVTIDDHGGIRMAVKHCYEKGHRRIGYAGMNSEYFCGHQLDRIGGYYEGLYLLGLPIRPDYIFHQNENGRNRTPAEMLDYYFSLDEKPTVLICANDNLAINLMKEASRRGLQLPDDLSFIGFDNTETAQNWVPALTTIHQKREDMGRAAVALLTRKIKEGRCDIPEKVLCEAELVIRESVASLLPHDKGD
ncbi:MAG: LacI family DNA-binding transcriptional regulator [Planctomycetota bacterium]|jgi:DNA-binding LacI/PurR family transcriptional regulator